MDRDLAVLLQAVTMNDSNSTKTYAEFLCRTNPDAFPAEFHSQLLQRLADRAAVTHAFRHPVL